MYIIYFSNRECTQSSLYFYRFDIVLYECYVLHQMLFDLSYQLIEFYCFDVSDVWNKSLSQRLRKLRRRCSSFSSAHSLQQQQQQQDMLEPKSSVLTAGLRSRLNQQTEAVPQPEADTVSTTSTSSKSSLLMLPAGLRSRLNQLQRGLRKKRSVSVHEMPSTFYVPAPMQPDPAEYEGPQSLPPATILQLQVCILNYTLSHSI
jgi:hypothetical protein